MTQMSQFFAVTFLSTLLQWELLNLSLLTRQNTSHCFNFSFFFFIQFSSFFHFQRSRCLKKSDTVSTWTKMEEMTLGNYAKCQRLKELLSETTLEIDTLSSISLITNIPSWIRYFSIEFLLQLPQRTRQLICSIK